MEPLGGVSLSAVLDERGQVCPCGSTFEASSARDFRAGRIRHWRIVIRSDRSPDDPDFCST
jgi:hypothetical protein